MMKLMEQNLMWRTSMVRMAMAWHGNSDNTVGDGGIHQVIEPSLARVQVIKGITGYYNMCEVTSNVTLKTQQTKWQWTNGDICNEQSYQRALYKVLFIIIYLFDVLSFVTFLWFGSLCNNIWNKKQLQTQTNFKWKLFYTEKKHNRKESGSA